MEPVSDPSVFDERDEHLDDSEEALDDLVVFALGAVVAFFVSW
jgi:hypothetical protein